MNSYAWLGISVFVTLTFYPLLKKENRTKEAVRKFIVTIAMILGIVVAVLIFKVNYLSAIIVGFLVLIVLDRKTYTKKRLLIYGTIILVLGIVGYAILRDNPKYVMNHLKNNPQTTSLYVAHNGEEVITYQSDVVRPLASTVKIIIAAEYAMQIDEGRLNKESLVSLEDLNRHYFERTDGGAHEAWLGNMRSEGGIKDNKVSLHEVAKGMITYSSNANTDYMIDLLGAPAINERAQALGLTQHEAVYPIVGALLIPSHIKMEEMDDKQLVQALEDMPMEAYRSLAEELSKELKEGTRQIGDAATALSMNVQKVWSDRLIGATANDYGKLMATISNDQFPQTAIEVLRDLLEWPMEFNESNKDRFTHLGIKGGSTAFVLTQALYAETLEGDKTEIVLLTDNLSSWEAGLLSRNLNSFASKLISDKDFRLNAQQNLMEK